MKFFKRKAEKSDNTLPAVDTNEIKNISEEKSGTEKIYDTGIGYGGTVISYDHMSKEFSVCEYIWHIDDSQEFYEPKTAAAEEVLCILREANYSPKLYPAIERVAELGGISGQEAIEYNKRMLDNLRKQTERILRWNAHTEQVRKIAPKKLLERLPKLPHYLHIWLEVEEKNGSDCLYVKGMDEQDNITLFHMLSHPFIDKYALVLDREKSLNAVLDFFGPSQTDKPSGFFISCDELEVCFNSGSVRKEYCESEDCMSYLMLNHESYHDGGGSAKDEWRLKPAAGESIPNMIPAEEYKGVPCSGYSCFCGSVLLENPFFLSGVFYFFRKCAYSDSAEDDESVTVIGKE